MNIRDFVSVLKDISFSEIRQEAMIPPRILIVTESNEEGATWRTRLFGGGAETFVDVVDGSRSDLNPVAYDAIVSIGPLRAERARAWADQFRRIDEEMLLVEIKPGQEASESELERLRRKVCDVARDRSVAFGRYIESMRTAAACEVISDTSRVNAQFAALSNIPAMVPIVGTILAAGADFLVLTKNQLMMIYRLAAIFDRDLDDRWRVYAELTPVVGAGLFWRTTARQIAALLPLALGAIPKVTIAYAGTYAVGQAARAYYEHGHKLSSEELDDVYRDALSMLGNARNRILRDAEQTDRLPETVAAPEPTDR